MMRVLTVILGVLLAASGIYCMLTPVATYSALSVVIGISMVAEGIASVITWKGRRDSGLANGWSLVGSIVSIVLGAFLLGSYFLQFAVDLYIAYVIAIWLVVAGGARIAAALDMRRSQDLAGGSTWLVQLILGVLIIILGILCLANPLSIMASVGMMLGISIVVVGVDLVVGSFTLE